MLVGDFETRSRASLKQLGPYGYAMHESTDALCFAYKIDDGATQLWLPGDPPPADLFEAIANGDIIHAHNAVFEIVICRFVMTPRYGWPEIPLDQWCCTAAQVAAICLPRSLDGACQVLNLPVQKDKRGRQLIKLLCEPQKLTKKNQSEWNNDPELLQELYDYCIRDVDAEYGLLHSTPALALREQRTWLLDQQINARGIPVDLESIECALSLIDDAKELMNSELAELTQFRVTAGTQVNDIIAFCRETLPVEIPNLQKGTVENLLDDPRVQGTPAATVLEYRQEASKTSTGKYSSMSRAADADGRVRDVLLYYGANTGRWSGKKMQPHNFPRVGVDEAVIDTLIQVIRRRDPELLDIMFPDGVMKTLSIALRNMIVADKGKKLVVVDFSAIEARVLAWLAGEEWKLQAFRDYDAGVGEDIYTLTANEINRLTGLPAERQIGKVAELALGYQGGVGAWSSMAKNYKLDLGQSEGEQADSVTREWCLSHWSGFCRLLDLGVNSPTRQVVDRGQRRGIVNSFTMPGGDADSWSTLKREALADTIKVAWRTAHPEIVAFWRDVEKAAIDAATVSGPHWAGPVCWYRQGRYLYCRLPCGRNLCYVDPAVEMRPITFDDNGVEKTISKRTLRYKRAKGPNWFKEFTYGGSLVENITQAVARDFLVEAMFKAEAAGYPIILHVHDEIVCEVDEGFGSHSELERIMSVIPPWGEGCPIAAAGFESKRYRK